MRSTIVLCALLLAVGACSSSDDAETTTTAPATTRPAETTTTIAPATTTAAPDTTAAPATTSTTSTTITPAPAMLALTRVVFEPIPYLLIRNVGGEPINLGDHWLCQRPAYVQLPELTMEGGDTVAIGLGDEAPPDLAGLVAVLQLGPELGFFTPDQGELGLYAAPDFGAPGAIESYVQWGKAGGGRESVAVEAGIWQEGEFVEIPPEALSISSSGQPQAGVLDWFADLGG